MSINLNSIRLFLNLYFGPFVFAVVGVGIVRRSALSRRGFIMADDDRDRALHAQAGGDLG